MHITTGPGYDWIVTFQWEDEEPETMSVFGVMTIEDAVREARYSLDSDDPLAPGYEILGVVRVGNVRASRTV